MVKQTIMTLIEIVNENNYHQSMHDPEARALLAGTLALMTLFAESRCPFGAERICDNPLRLSALPAMPWEFCAALAKLGARWSLLQAESTPPGPRGAARH
jgi:hypothetical protein